MCLKSNPRNPRARINYCITLHKLGKIEDAERELRLALRRFPNMAKAAAELGHVLAETGRYREAAEWYRKAIELGREDLIPRLRQMERLAS